MPYQVSWQFVSIKSQTPVHVLGAEALGAEAAMAGEVAVGGISAAHAPLAAPAAAMIVAAKMPSLVMAAPLPNMDDRDSLKAGRQGTVGAICTIGAKFPS